MSSPVIVHSGGPNLLIRFLWFLFIGWWLGGIVSGIAWFCVLTVIGLPLGLWLMNRLPTMITLRPQEQRFYVDGNVIRKGEQQRPFWIRAVYFILIGFWFSGVWMLLAYVACVTLLLLPVGFWMYGRVGAVTTLYRS